MNSFIFILACSGKKKDVEECLAGELYDGEIFKKGKSIADTWEIPFWILSAAHGIITPDQKIKSYNQKLIKPYKGPFPPTPYYGFYVGGQSYFKNFPDTFLPLVEPGPIGKMLSRLKNLVDNPEAAKAVIRSHPYHASV